MYKTCIDKGNADRLRPAEVTSSPTHYFLQHGYCNICNFGFKAHTCMRRWMARPSETENPSGSTGGEAVDE